MSKWCNECHLNKQTGEYMSCSQECPISGKDFEELSSLYIQQFIKSKQGKQLHFKLFKERCSLMPQYNEFDFISNINKRFGTTYHAIRQKKNYKITWEIWFETNDGTKYDISKVEKSITHNAMYKALFKKEFEITKVYKGELSVIQSKGELI